MANLNAMWLFAIPPEIKKSQQFFDIFMVKVYYL